MRFVAIKTEEKQAVVGIQRVRDVLMKQHWMLITQLRGLMAEFGRVAAKGVPHVDELLAVLADADDRRIPEPLRGGLTATAEVLRAIDRKLEAIDGQIVAAGREEPGSRKFITATVLGPRGSSPDTHYD